MSTESAPLPPSIPDYELLRLIGRGAYGEVWLARGVTGIYRAVKVVWRDRFPEAGPYEREFHGLKQFAEISLSESRQLALLHVGRDPGATYFYYVMELADDTTTGREIDPANYTPLTLKEMRARRGRLSAGECITLGAELARALAGLHARGLVHRDIKPSNVVIVGGAPKLADIGLVTEASAALTFVGTEGFVPPEGPGAPAADVFGLGKLLYELLTGLDRHDYPRLPPELHTWPDRKDALELNEVLIRACESHPDQRHPDATALLDDLLLLQAGKSLRRLRKAERRLARALRIAAVLALIAGVAGLGAYIERQRANQEMVLRAQAEAERDALARRTVYSAALTQAQRSLELDDYGRARNFLDGVVPKPGEPDLREFEWYALRHEANGDPAAVLLRSGPPGTKVCFSPDGTLLATQGDGLQVVLWDRAAQREVRRVPNVHLAGFSANGRFLLGVDEKYTLRRWAVADGTAVDSTPASIGQDWPLGQLKQDEWLTLVLARGVRPQQLRAWDFATGRELWRGTIPHTTGPAEMELGAYLASAIAPDGRSCAISFVHDRGLDVRWRVMVLNLPEMTVRWEQLLDHRPSMLAFGRTPNELVCGWGDTGDTGLLDLNTGQWRWQTRLPMTHLRTAVADEAGRLAVGGRSSRIAFLDLATGKITGARFGQESDLTSLAYDPGSRELASTGNGGDVRLWPLAESSPPLRVDDYWSPAGGGRALCLSPDGKLLAATAAKGLVRIVRTDTGETVTQIPHAILPVSFVPDTGVLWLLSSNASITAWLPEQAGKTAPDPISLPIQPIIAATTPDCRWLVCADKEGRMVSVDLTRRQVSAVIKSGHSFPWWITVAPDGTRFATGGVDAMARLWELSSGRKLAEWKPSGESNNACFAPDGRHLALTQSTGRLEVRDLVTGTTAASLVTTSGTLQCAVFDPIAPRAFLGGRDGSLLVVDTRRWQEITQLKAAPGTLPGGLVRNAISADGKTLAGYTESGVIRLWRKGTMP